MSMFKSSPKLFKKIYILKERQNQQKILTFIKLIQSKKSNIIQLVNRKYLDKQSKGAVHQGMIAYVFLKDQQFQEKDLLNLIKKINNIFLLILDGITDPHNLGACLRTANAAGVHAVIVPRDRSATLNATVRKIACGSAENIPLIRVTNLIRTIKFLKSKNIWIFGATTQTKNNLYNSKMIGHIAIVMGSEGKGMHRLTQENCDELISIPMSNNMSSLNVSVATGICLFEAVRQRRLMFCNEGF